MGSAEVQFCSGQPFTCSVCPKLIGYPYRAKPVTRSCAHAEASEGLPGPAKGGADAFLRPLTSKPSSLSNAAALGRGATSLCRPRWLGRHTITQRLLGVDT